MAKGFTLLELIIVIVILGILASLGYTQYTKVVENGRTAEAKAILGQLRSAQITYKMEHGAYASTLVSLPVNVPTSCASTHYFSYLYSSGAAGFCFNEPYAYASRCTSGGKSPQGIDPWLVRCCLDSGRWHEGPPNVPQ